MAQRPAWRNPRRTPINIPGDTHPIPIEALSWLPKFNNDGSISPEAHISILIRVLDSFEIEYEDVAVQLFVASFEGSVQEWFYSLPTGFITCWANLESSFLIQYSRHRNHSFATNNLIDITQNYGESIVNFNDRFVETYSKLPRFLKPPEGLLVQSYQKSLNPQLSYALKYENHTSLSEVMNAAIRIESQAITAHLIETPLETIESNSTVASNAPYHSETVVNLQENDTNDLQDLRRMVQDLTNELNFFKQSMHDDIQSYQYHNDQQINYDQPFESCPSEYDHQVDIFRNYEEIQHQTDSSTSYEEDQSHSNLNQIDEPDEFQNTQSLENHESFNKQCDDYLNRNQLEEIIEDDPISLILSSDLPHQVPESSELQLNYSNEDSDAFLSSNPSSDLSYSEESSTSSLDLNQSDDSSTVVDDSSHSVQISEGLIEYIDQSSSIALTSKSIPIDNRNDLQLNVLSEPPSDFLLHESNYHEIHQVPKEHDSLGNFRKLYDEKEPYKDVDYEFILTPSDKNLIHSPENNLIQSNSMETQIDEQNFQLYIPPDILNQQIFHFSIDEMFPNEIFLSSSFENYMNQVIFDYHQLDSFVGFYDFTIHQLKTWIDLLNNDFYDKIYLIDSRRKYLIHFYPP